MREIFHVTSYGPILDWNPFPSLKTQTFKSEICVHKQRWYNLDGITGMLILWFLSKTTNASFLDTLLVILTHQENGKPLCPVKRETSQPKLPVFPFWVDCSRKNTIFLKLCVVAITNVWHRDMKCRDAAEEMAPMDLLHSGLPQTFNL